jgi:hypothetical protein
MVEVPQVCVICDVLILRWHWGTAREQNALTDFGGRRLAIAAFTSERLPNDTYCQVSKLS